MLKKFEVKNFKNFKERISIDFSKVGGYQFSKDCISNNMIGKMLIYGKNATGKTNLGRAITDIRKTLIFPSIGNNNLFLNADSSEEYAEFVYYFQFGTDEVKYLYRKKSANIICYEELSINGQEFFVNEIAFRGMVLTPSEELLKQNININRYIEVYEENDDVDGRRTIPFLRWMVNNTALEEDSIPMMLYNYVKEMFFVSLQTVSDFRFQRSVEDFFNDLAKERHLKDLEEFLNAMGVQCELRILKLPDGTAELYFKHDRLIPFIQTASSGTIALLSIYRRLYNLKDVSFMYIDEFDAFYHYEMAENMIAYLKKRYPRCQIILTTHNTNLMTNRIMRPDCLFILSTYGTLTPLCEATTRELREGHNLEKMYISGEFEAYE